MGTTISDEQQQTEYADRIQELYAATAPSALRLAYFLSGSRDLAQDLVQEAFVRLTGRFRHRRLPDEFPSYLRRTIVNEHASLLRRRRLERAWLRKQRSDPDAQAPHDPAERDELWQALQRLPLRQRAALVLRFYEDLSERQAADVLGCSPGAVNQLVTRGLARLREDMRRHQ